jgi:hypothetical protein
MQPTRGGDPVPLFDVIRRVLTDIVERHEASEPQEPTDATQTEDAYQSCARLPEERR